MSVFKKIYISILLGIATIATVFIATPTTVNAAQNLQEAFNFFNVKCLVPDGGSNPTENLSPLGSVRPCKEGGASLLDQAINFMYMLGPALAVLVVMWGGYLYYNSVFGGNDAKRAFETVKAGIIGLTIIMAVPIVYKIMLTLSAANTTKSQDFFTVLAKVLILDILKPIADVGIVAGAAFAVISFIYAGYLYLVGNAENGKKALQNAFIGLIVVLASVMIVSLTQLGFGLFKK